MSTKWKLVSISFEADLYAAFAERSRKRGHDRSEVLEAAMRSYLEQGSPRVLLRDLQRGEGSSALSRARAGGGPGRKHG